MSNRTKNIFRGFAFVIALIILGYWLLIASLPGVTTIENYRPESTVIDLSDFDWNKDIIAPVRKYVPLSKISPELRTAVLISEDDTFFGHSGINITELKKAFQENLEKKRYARGASTITMQVVKNAFLTQQKTLTRKIKEILLAKKIEKLWSKQKIFEYYLNIAEWGHNIYGAEAAARYYFNKPASQLDLAEASLLAGMLPNPKILNPFKNWNRVKNRQQRVLRLMRNARLITDLEFENLLSQRIYLRGSAPKIEEQPMIPDISIFDEALKDPRIPKEFKDKADSTGIIFIPEDEKNDSLK
ncbi:transglycosylase domain-containing protein [candidate division KSB1 bacterium]|nr:transglycosylase domain-containing protein [candidate division KSB1 bacterium]